MTIKHMATILVIVTIAAIIDLHLFTVAWTTHEEVREMTATYTQEQSFVNLATSMGCDHVKRRGVAPSPAPSPAATCTHGPDRIEQMLRQLRHDHRSPKQEIAQTGRAIVALVHYYHLKLDSLTLATSSVEIKTDGPVNPTLRFLRGLSTHRTPIVPSSLTLSAQAHATVHLDWNGTYLSI